MRHNTPAENLRNVKEIADSLFMTFKTNKLSIQAARQILSSSLMNQSASGALNPGQDITEIVNYNQNIAFVNSFSAFRVDISRR
jgi:hypothetical protein